MTMAVFGQLCRAPTHMPAVQHLTKGSAADRLSRGVLRPSLKPRRYGRRFARRRALSTPTAMFVRFRFVSYVALTVLAFGTLGRAPRLVTLRAQDLPAAVSAATQSGE